MSKITDLSKMSVEELEAALKDKKKKEKADAEAAERLYITERDEMIVNLSLMAEALNEQLALFSETAHESMRQQKTALDNYGKIRKNSKGGFHITSSEGLFKIVYAYRSIVDYDERADKAEELLKEFIEDLIKKGNKKGFNLVKSLLERNKAGQLEYSRISLLYKHENEFDDPRWREALQLFKDSFKVRDSKMQPMFYKKNDKNTYELINLNFSSI